MSKVQGIAAGIMASVTSVTGSNVQPPAQNTTQQPTTEKSKDSGSISVGSTSHQNSDSNSNREATDTDKLTQSPIETNPSAKQLTATKTESNVTTSSHIQPQPINNPEVSEVKTNNVPTPIKVSSTQHTVQQLKQDKPTVLSSDNSDLQITIGSPTAVQTSPSGSLDLSTQQSGTPSYQPGKIFNNGISVIKSGNGVNFKIPFALQSKSGQSYKIASAVLQMSPSQYNMNNSTDQQDITNSNVGNRENSAVFSGHIKAITLNGLTSSSTGELNAYVTGINGNWKQAINWDMSVKITLENGQVITKPVNIPDSEVTNINLIQYVPLFGSNTFSNFPITRVPNKNEWNTTGDLQTNDANTVSPTEAKSIAENMSSLVYTIQQTAPNFAITSTNPEVKVEGDKLIISPEYLSQTALDGYTPAKLGLHIVYTGPNPKNSILDKITLADPVINYSNKNKVAYATKFTASTASFDVTAFPVGGYNIIQNGKLTSPQSELGLSQWSSTYNSSTEANNLAGKFNMTTYNWLNQDSDLGNDSRFPFTDPNVQRFYTKGSEFASIPALNSIEGFTDKQLYSDLQSAHWYTYDQIMQMIKSGKPIPVMNVQRVQGSFDKSGKQELDTPLAAPNTNMGGQWGTFSVITSDDSNVVSQLHNGYNAKQDMELPNGVLLTSAHTPNSSGIFETARFGALSSAGFMYAPGTTSVGLCIDGNNNGPSTIYSQNVSGTQSNTPVTMKSDWLNNTHLIQIQPGYGAGNSDYNPNNPNLFYKKGSQFVINMDSPFVLNGGVTLSGVSCPYKVEGNKLIVTVPKDIYFTGVNPSYTSGGSSLNSHLIPGTQLPLLSFNAAYTGIGLSTVNISLDSSPTIYEKFNNSVVVSATSLPVNQQINFVQNQLVNCKHSTSGLVDGKATMVDTIYNNQNKQANYVVMSSAIGDGLNISSAEGKNNSASLSSTISALPSGDVYYITKSKATAQDISLLQTSNVQTLQDNIPNITSNWTQYKGGAIPNDVIGFAVFNHVAPKQSLSFNYGLNQGVKPGQSVYSGFKYFNFTTGTGSTSNIVQLDGPPIPNNIITEEMVNTAGGIVHPQSQLVSAKEGSTVTYTPYSSSDVPKDTFVTQITVNGKVVASNKYGIDLSSLKLGGLLPNKIADTPTHIVYTVSPSVLPAHKAGINATTVYQSNWNQVPNSSEYTNGILGTNADMSKVQAVVPSGYHLVEAYLGKDKQNGITVPQLKYTYNDQAITWVVARNTGKVTANSIIEGQSSPVANSEQSFSGDTETPVPVGSNGIHPVIPAGYQVSKILINGSPVTASDISTLQYQTNTQNIQYVLTPLPKHNITETVQVIGSNGKVVDTLVNNKLLATGYQGEGESVPLYQYNKDMYTLQSTTINGNKVDYSQSSMPTDIGTTDTNIVYTLTQNPSNVTVETKIGNSVISTNTVNGVVGQSVPIPSYTTKPGYHLTQTLVNNTVSTAGPSFTLLPKDSTIIYNLSPNPSSVVNRTVNVVNPTTGKVVSTLVSNVQIANGLEGQSVSIPAYTVDTSKYTLHSNTLDGSTITNTTQNTTLTKPVENQVITLYENPSKVTVTTKIEGSNEVVGTPVTVNGFIGNSVDIPSAVTKPGYHLVSESVNGTKQDSTNVNSLTLTKPSESVTWYLAPNPTGNVTRTVEVYDTKGNLVTTLENDKEIASGLSGTTGGITPYNVDTTKYTLTGVTLNNKPYNNNANTITFNDGSQNEIIKLTENYGKLDYQTVNDTTNTVVDSSVGNFDSPITSTVDANGKQVVPNGYKLTSVTLNGKVVTLQDLNNIPITSTPQHVVFHISKIYNATNTVVGEDGHVFTPVTPIGSGITGDTFKDVEPTLPDNYHLTSVVITDGTKSTTVSAKDFKDSTLPTKFDKGNISIKYIVAENRGSVVASTVVDGETKPVPTSVENVSGVTGTSVTGITPVVLPGYKIKEVYLNGKIVPESDIASLKYTTGSQQVKYVLTPLPKNTIVETVQVVNSKGTVIKTIESNKELANGYLGEKETVPLYDYNKDLYSLKNMTVNGTQQIYRDSSLPTSIASTPTSIVYTLVQNPSAVTVKTVIQGSNKEVGTTETVNGFVGDSVSVPPSNTLAGYHLVDTTVNGKSVPSVSTVQLGTTDSRVVYTLAPNPKAVVNRTVVVKDPYTNKVVSTIVDSKEIASGFEGQAEDITPYSVDTSKYTLVSTTMNGKGYSNVDSKYVLPAGTSNEVITLVQNKAKVVVNTQTNTGEAIGNPITINSVIGGTPTIPGNAVKPGYHLTKVEVNGANTGNLNVPKVDLTGDVNITYTIAPNPTGVVNRTVNIEDPYTHKIVKTLEDNKQILSGLSGTTATLGKYDYDTSKYSMVSDTFDGKAITNDNSQITYTEKPQSQVITLVENKANVNISTVTDSGNPVGKLTDIPTIIGATPTLPGANTEAGYHITKATVNGKDVPIDKVPSLTVTTPNNKVVYTLSPNPTRKVIRTVNIIDPYTNKVIKSVEVNDQIASGLEGTSVKIPSYAYNKDQYTLQSETMNGKAFNNVDTSVALGKIDDSIVINLVENKANLVVSTVNGNEEVGKPSTTNSHIGGTVSVTGPNSLVGYHVGSVTVNGKVVESAPSTIVLNGNEKVTYHLVPNAKQVVNRTINVVSPYTNKIVKVIESNKEIASGLQGTSVTLPDYSAPENTKVVSNEVNGNLYKGEKLTYGDKAINQVITVTELPADINVETVVGDKVIGKPSVVKSLIGDKVAVAKVTKDPGYHIDYITINGKVVKDVPDSITLTGNTDVVYHLVPNNSVVVKRTVNIVDPTTHKVIKTIESNVDIANGLSGTSVNIPAYKVDSSKYDLVSDTLDGKAFTDGNVTLGDKDMNQVIDIAAKPVTLTVSTDINGTAIETPEVIHSLMGSSVDVPKALSKKGYTLGSIVVNGKVVTAVPSPLLLDGNATVVYNLVPKKVIAPKTFTCSNEVITDSGEIKVPLSEIAHGSNGSTFIDKEVTMPVGYHLVSVVINDGTTTTISASKFKPKMLPTKFKNSDITITYIIAKDEQPVPVVKPAVTQPIPEAKPVVINKTTTINSTTDVINTPSRVPVSTTPISPRVTTTVPQTEQTPEVVTAVPEANNTTVSNAQLPDTGENNTPIAATGISIAALGLAMLTIFKKKK